MDVITFMFPAAETCVRQGPNSLVFIVADLTLTPFTPTPWHLAFDKLEYLELQHRLVDLQHPFQDLLRISIRGQSTPNLDSLPQKTDRLQTHPAFI